MKPNIETPKPAETGSREGALASSCCTPKEKESCCEASAKAECCGAEASTPAAPSTCGCR